MDADPEGVVLVAPKPWVLPARTRLCRALARQAPACRLPKRQQDRWHFAVSPNCIRQAVRHFQARSNGRCAVQSSTLRLARSLPLTRPSGPCLRRTQAIPLACIFHTRRPERRSVTGLPSSPRSKPVTDRRSTLSAVRAECEICRLATRAAQVSAGSLPFARRCDPPPSHRPGPRGDQQGGSQKQTGNAGVGWK